MPGMSIAIDIPNTSRSHAALQTIIAEIVERGGRIYPAKDALMGPEQFQRMYPLWHQVERLRDPRCCSEFWQRVTKLT
jgi:FAD/FMN-containing dehydrogenase